MLPRPMLRVRWSVGKTSDMTGASSAPPAAAFASGLTCAARAATMVAEPELAAMNITLMVHGDFARDLPSSDHAPCLSALVIGTNVKVGTTGQVSAKVTLPEDTGASKQMWSYLAECAKVAQNPFGVKALIVPATDGPSPRPRPTCQAAPGGADARLRRAWSVAPHL